LGGLGIAVPTGIPLGTENSGVMEGSGEGMGIGVGVGVGVTEAIGVGVTIGVAVGVTKTTGGLREDGQPVNNPIPNK
jgi:hypothetical protein